MADYQHTQSSRWYRLMFLLPLGLTILAYTFRQATQPLLPLIFLAAAALQALVCATLQSLTVVDEGEWLRLKFGPLPLFRRRVRYDQIRGVKVARTTVLDGWGIHYSMRGGWVWNHYGRDCVELQLPRRKLFIGSDDAANLALFLHRRCRHLTSNGEPSAA